MKPTHLIVVTTLTAALTACGQPSDSGGQAATSGPETTSGPEAASAPQGASPELVAALRCWGYTQSSYILHIASPERAADIPQASQDDMGGWNDRALRLAHAADMTLSEFTALRDEVAVTSTDLIDQEDRLAAAGPIQACIDTAPDILPDQPDLRQD